jgi:hypothetical protein
MESVRVWWPWQVEFLAQASGAEAAQGAPVGEHWLSGSVEVEFVWVAAGVGVVVIAALVFLVRRGASRRR